MYQVSLRVWSNVKNARILHFIIFVIGLHHICPKLALATSIYLPFVLFLYHPFLFTFTALCQYSYFLPILFSVASTCPHNTYFWVHVCSWKSCSSKYEFSTPQTVVPFLTEHISVFLLTTLCLQFHHTFLCWAVGHGLMDIRKLIVAFMQLYSVYVPKN